MPLDQQLLGQKLQRYRNQFNRTVAEVSEATGIGQERLLAYEAGASAPSGDEILIFADYYLCDYKFFISNEKLAPFEETETMFRRYGDEFSSEDRWAVQEFLFLSECEHFLQQAFLTDDKNAFRLAVEVLPTGRVQTTPDLFCWLIFEQPLGDSDKQVVISQHESMKRPLREQFEESYSLALQYRLASRSVVN